MRLAGKVALITGAGSGIGRATAVLFAQEGAKVVIGDVAAEKGKATLWLVRQAGAEGLFVQADVSQATDAERLVAKTIAAFGRLDILVNNAGIIVPGRVDNTPEDVFDRAMRVNVKGAFLVSGYAVRAMRQTGGGVIVINASAAALKGFPDRAAYSASKGALVALTRAMARDHIKESIRVNCVCPGTTDTPALAERMQDSHDPEAARAALIARQPLGRLGRDEEIAQTMLFACCPEASFLTGSIITIDGGATL